MDSCVNNNSLRAVERMSNQGSRKKISHETASAHKRGDLVSAQASPRPPESGSSNITSTIFQAPPQSPTSTESQSPCLPTRRRHSRTKVALHHLRPLSRGVPVDLRVDHDAVTDTVSRALIRDHGSLGTHNSTRRQRGTSSATPESPSNRLSRSLRQYRLHTNTVDLAFNLDTISSLQGSQRRTSTASNSSEETTAEDAPVDASRRFRARLVLAEARKMIENHKPVWSDTARERSRRQRSPFIMDIVLELMAQYAGYTTEDMYVTFEAMRRKEDVRPVFEYLAHDFSTGAESVDAYWDSQARVWEDWKTPADECVDGVGDTCGSGSTFPARHSPEVAPVNVGVPENVRATPPSSSLCLGRASFPDSIERSTASWCPVLNCDYVPDYHGHLQGAAVLSQLEY